MLSFSTHCLNVGSLNSKPTLLRMAEGFDYFVLPLYTSLQIKNKQVVKGHESEPDLAKFVSVVYLEF